MKVNQWRLLGAAGAVIILIFGAGCGGDTDGDGDDPVSAGNDTTDEVFQDEIFEDSEFSDLVSSCEDGDMSDCDDLWFTAPSGSSEEAFGDTCGGRQLTNTEDWCDPASEDRLNSGPEFEETSSSYSGTRVSWNNAFDYIGADARDGMCEQYFLLGAREFADQFVNTGDPSSWSEPDVREFIVDSCESLYS